MGLVGQEQAYLWVITELSLGGKGQSLAVYHDPLLLYLNAGYFSCGPGLPRFDSRYLRGGGIHLRLGAPANRLHREYDGDQAGDGGDHRQRVDQPAIAGSSARSHIRHFLAGRHKLALHVAQVVIRACLFQQPAGQQRARVAAEALPLLGRSAHALALA